METFEKDGEFGFKRVVTKQEEQNFSLDYLKDERSRLVESLAVIDALIAKAVELGVKETINPSGESVVDNG